MKKLVIILMIIVIVVFSVVLYTFKNQRLWTECSGGIGNCGGPPPECSTLTDTTCKTQCDDRIEQKIDGPFCETENFVCCQLKLYPSK